MKKAKQFQFQVQPLINNNNNNNNNNGLSFSYFDLLSEEIVFTILDLLTPNPLDKKSFSLGCKNFYFLESKHRRILKPLRSEYLPKVLTRYPHVTHMDLTLCPRVTDATLTNIAGACNSNLVSVDLSMSKFFTGVGLLNLAVKCENLVELDLTNATELKDGAAAMVAEARNLERLWMRRCRMVTDLGVGCIAVGCRKLKLLSLKWCVGVGDLGVGLIAVKCKDIRSLDLSYLPKLDMSSCEKITHIGLSSVFSCTICLEQVTLANGCSVNLDLADSLNKLSKLQSIKLDGCPVTCAGLGAIGDWCVSLKELSLSKCLGVTDEGLTYLFMKQKDLRILDITCCDKITDVSISHITSSCTDLSSLKMESCALVPREAFILIGQRCHSLEELDLTDNEIDDEGLKSISKCSKLSSFKLGLCLNITDEGLAHIGMSCVGLKELDLYRCTGITDSGILAIAGGCPGLEMINIAYCKEITDDSLLLFSKCAQLNTIECRGCPHITSLGLAAIAAGCKQLTKLDIKKCYKVDDAGMIPLAYFSQNLKQINLSYSSVTDVGLLSLASISCLQTLTILHLKGLTPSGLAAALLACGGLTKVKLHASFKSLLPQAIFEHLEARGCLFQWREKVFKAELDPKCWKRQLEDMMQ
ncbi:f-box/lrr-repeat protein 3 [Quercus suber]|uniref:F-box/lrr-repeat protein 3 n=1 Tax=Quercus suber TaxID=58331 RepID=A0AAW0KAW3_QUESU